ncbi:MAG: 16S rRNA pseudouridine(516) synthase [Lachnospiraceae bacterium]|nr:16S rRNA pseudouridine(516) synthase [Lachnospiraceae bacterium]
MRLIRIDKYLCDNAGLSRSEAKKAVLSSKVTINNIPVKRCEAKLLEGTDTVTLNGDPIIYEKYSYYMLNKPSGYVSANSDSREKTVIELFSSEKKKNLACVGRLDKDTTGLLLVTNDGELIHKLISPRKNVFKDYLVTIVKALTVEDIKALEEGVDINDPALTRPAKVRVIDDNNIILSITEGRFHQVKRMLIAVGNAVVKLKRISEGSLKLDDSLSEGQYRKLTPDEIDMLKAL